MAKFYGEIGYSKSTEIRPGVWDEVITKKDYSGDVVRNNRRVVPSDTLNDNVVISNEISIVADPFANENIYCMKYVKYMGVLWKVLSVEVQYPRLILSLGGVYNE